MFLSFVDSPFGFSDRCVFPFFLDRLNFPFGVGHFGECFFFNLFFCDVQAACRVGRSKLLGGGQPRSPSPRSFFCLIPMYEVTCLFPPFFFLFFGPDCYSLYFPQIVSLIVGEAPVCFPPPNNPFPFFLQYGTCTPGAV